jgi:hypothetical protein
MGQHEKLLRTDSRLHEAVEVFTQQQIDVLKLSLQALMPRIRIDELRCSLRAHH